MIHCEVVKVKQNNNVYSTVLRVSFTSASYNINSNVIVIKMGLYNII